MFVILLFTKFINREKYFKNLKAKGRFLTDEWINNAMNIGVHRYFPISVFVFFR